MLRIQFHEKVSFRDDIKRINDLSSKLNNSLEDIFPPPIGKNRQKGLRRHQRNSFARFAMVLEVSFPVKFWHRVRVRIPKLLRNSSWKPRLRP